MKGELAMKDNIFSPKVYVQSLRKVRTLGIAMMIAIVLLNIFPPLTALTRSVDYYDYYDVNPTVGYEDRLPEPQVLYDMELAPFLWLLVFFAPAMVYFMFSFLNDRKKSDFYHSLPQTRVCVYVSMTAAVLTWIIGVILLSASLNGILWSFSKFHTVSPMIVLSNIAHFSSLSVYLASFMAVAMMITGEAVSNLLAFGFLLIFPRYAYNLFCLGIDSVTLVLPSDWFDDGIFSIENWILFSWAERELLSASRVYSLLSGISLFAIGGLLYRFRRSESAGKSAPNGKMQHLYRILFTSTVSVLIAYAVVEGSSESILFLVIAMVVVYLLYELATTRKVQKMLKSLPLLLVPIAISIGLLILQVGIGTAIYFYCPDAEDVESVTFSNVGNRTYNDAQMQNIELSDPETIALALEIYRREYTSDSDLYSSETVAVEEYQDQYQQFSYGEQNLRYEIDFNLKNGRTVSRVSKYMTYADWEAICLLEANIDRYLSIPTREKIASGMGDLSLSNAERQEIADCFIAEYESFSEEEKIQYLRLARDVERIPYGLRCDAYSSWEYPLTLEWTPKTIECLQSCIWGNHERLLYALEKEANTEESNYIQLVTLMDGGYREIGIDSAFFFECVKVDDHLFDSENGVAVQYTMQSGTPCWIYLTKEEWNGFSENANIVAGKWG